MKATHDVAVPETAWCEVMDVSFSGFVFTGIIGDADRAVPSLGLTVRRSDLH